MREIRFRAWNKEGKEMLYPSQVYSFPVNWKHTLFLMQYTGLRDKNDRQIYEHDVVIWDGGQYTVIFSETEGAWILKDDRADWECPSLYGVSSPKQSRIVVIGNIYENPEPLEKP